MATGQGSGAAGSGGNRSGMPRPARTGPRLRSKKELFIENKFTGQNWRQRVPSRSKSPCGTRRGREPGWRGFVECEFVEAWADRMRGGERQVPPRRASWCLDPTCPSAQGGERGPTDVQANPRAQGSSGLERRCTSHPRAGQHASGGVALGEAPPPPEPQVTQITLQRLPAVNAPPGASTLASAYASNSCPMHIRRLPANPQVRGTFCS